MARRSGSWPGRTGGSCGRTATGCSDPSPEVPWTAEDWRHSAMESSPSRSPCLLLTWRCRTRSWPAGPAACRSLAVVRRLRRQLPHHRDHLGQPSHAVQELRRDRPHSAVPQSPAAVFVVAIPFATATIAAYLSHGGTDASLAAVVLQLVFEGKLSCSGDLCDGHPSASRASKR